MLRTFVVLGLVAVIIVLYFNFSNTGISYQSNEISQSSETALENNREVASSSGDTYQQPVVTENVLEGGYREVAVEKPFLKFDLPENWTYKFEGFRDFDFEDKKYYHLNGELTSGDGEKIAIIVNFQGGWCEGPDKIEPVLLPDKYGLAARNYKCGSDIYVYGDMEKSGSVIPNLFISTKDGADSEVDRILKSIEHRP